MWSSARRSPPRLSSTAAWSAARRADADAPAPRPDEGREALGAEVARGGAGGLEDAVRQQDEDVARAERRPALAPRDVREAAEDRAGGLEDLVASVGPRDEGPRVAGVDPAQLTGRGVEPGEEEGGVAVRRHRLPQALVHGGDDAGQRMPLRARARAPRRASEAISSAAARPLPATSPSARRSPPSSGLKS